MSCLQVSGRGKEEMEKARREMAAHLSDTQVQGVVPPLGIHLLCEQPVGLHHHKRVGCLHGEEEIVVIVVTADVRKLKRALHLRTPGHPYFPLRGTSQEKVPRSSLFNCYQPAGKSRCLHACCSAYADITAQETPTQSHTPPWTTQARVGTWVVDQVQYIKKMESIAEHAHHAAGGVAVVGEDAR